MPKTYDKGDQSGSIPSGADATITDPPLGGVTYYDGAAYVEVDSTHGLPVAVVGTVAVSLASIPLATGAATADKQDDQSTLLNAIGLLLSGTLTVGGTVAVSALPAGLATSAKQDTGNTSLASIDGKLPALSGGAVPVTGSLSVTGGLTDAELRASAVPVSLTGAATEAKQDAGNTSLTSIDGKLPNLVTGRVPVDGSAVTQPVSGTFWQATQPVSGPLTDAQLRASAVPVSLTSTTVTGTVAVTQSGAWNITDVSGTVSLPTGAATAANQATEIGSLASIDTKTPALGQALAAGSVPVVLTAAQLTTLTPLATVAVTQSTSPWVVSLASTTVTGTVAVTQSGAWTVDLGATDNAVLDAIAASVAGTLTVGTHAVTQSGTWTNTVTQGTAANLNATVVGTGTFLVQAAQSGSWTVTANAGTDLNTSALALESGGNLAAAATSLSSIDTKTPALGQALAAASVPVVLTASQLTTLTPPAAISGFATESTLSTLSGKVTACNTGAVVLAAGTAAFGKLAANSGVDIGDVDVTSVPANPFGLNADAASATGSISAKLRFIASTGIPITGTVTVGSHAVTNAGVFAVQVSSALPAGTNAIGKLAANSGVTIGAVEIASAQTLATVTTVGTVTTCSTVTSLSQFAGNAIALGSGDVSAGTLRTREAGSPSLTCGQVSVTGSATQICAARAGRRAVIITQHGTTDVFLGGSGVGASDGLLLTGTAGAIQVIPGSAAVYGITASGSQTVSYAEIY